MAHSCSSAMITVKIIMTLWQLLVKTLISQSTTKSSETFTKPRTTGAEVMALIRIGDRHIDVDILEELEQYEWENARWTDTKLIASSPFRNDSAPSFYVDISGSYAGVFGDSGAYDSYYESGTLPKLLAYLRN